MSGFRPASGIVLKAVAAGLLLPWWLQEANAQEFKLQPGLMPGTLVQLTDARDTAWCELTVVIEIAPRESFRSPATAPDPALGNGSAASSASGPAQPVAQLYNTTGTSGPEGGCPPEAFAALDGSRLAEALSADEVYMNPTPQIARRRWVMDELRIYRAGETVDFMGVAATWVGAVPIEQVRKSASAPYAVVEIHDESRYVYLEGSTVFLLRSPGYKTHSRGNTWVMQSYTTEVDAELSFEQLAELGDRLKLPAGWTFETQRVKKKFTVDPRNAYGKAHIIRDDLHNVYAGCGFGTTCSYSLVPE